MAYSLKYSYNSSSQSYTVTGYSNITTSDKVVIPHGYNNGTNGEHPVKSIGDNAFMDCSNLTSVTIGNSVTSIGGNAFNNCKSLTSVTIPNSVTSIGPYAFYNCSSLTSITIPNSVTSISSYMFCGCYNLTSVTMPDGVTSIGSAAFSACYNLTSVTIPDSVTNMGEMAFGNCYSLTSVTIPDNVTNMGNDVFRNCTNLKQLILFPSTPPTLGSTTAIPTNVQSIYVRQSSKAAYKAATNWTTFASKIIPDDMYLSLARFNQKNKEYIDNSDSLLANSLMGSGVQGTGNPPLQGYNKNKDTIENRFKTAEQTTNKFHSSYQNDFPAEGPTNEIHIPLRSINNADVYTFFFVMIAIYDNSNSKFLNCCMTIGNGESATGYFIIKEAFSNSSIKTVSCTYSTNSNGVYILTGPSDKVSGKFKYELLKAAVLRIN